MKIAIINQPWTVVEPPVISASLPKWSFQFAQHLVPTHEVIYYARRARRQKKNETYAGIQFRRLSGPIEQYLIKVIEHLSFLFKPKKPFFSSRLYYLAYAIQIARDLRKQKCDIVHILNFSQFVSIIRIFNPDIRIVLNMRCEWLSQLDQEMIASRLEKADMIIGCCEYVTDKIRQQFPEYDSICFTVHNPVNADEFVEINRNSSKEATATKKLLFVGRVSPEKGLHHLLEAFKKVLERHPETELEIVGPEWRAPRDFILDLWEDDKLVELELFYNGRDYLPQLKEKLSPELLPRVTFSGFVPHNELPQHYLNADIFAHPSLADWFPKAIIEAMASRLPVVATNVGGIPEALIDKKTGILVEPGDVNALAEAISDLLDEPDQRRAMGDEGRQRVLNLFSWDRIASQFLSKYKMLLETNK